MKFLPYLFVAFTFMGVLSLTNALVLRHAPTTGYSMGEPGSRVSCGRVM